MSGRLLWLDLARGFAVVSMVIAHTSPWGGVLSATEYLTAPWFALLVGISLLLAWEKAGAGAGVGSRSGVAGRFILANVARGLLLIILGEWLQGVYWQIDVVLQTLGLLTIVLAPLVVLVGSRPLVWAGVALVVAVVSPVLMDATRRWLAAGMASGGGVPGWLPWLADVAVTGANYRITSFLAIAAAGIAATPALVGDGGMGRAGSGMGRGGSGMGRAGSGTDRSGSGSVRVDSGADPPAGPATGGVRGLLTAGSLLTAAAGAYLVGRLGPWGADAYSGTTPEILGAILLSLSATWVCAWLAATLGPRRVRAWLGAVVDTGRMALTAYTVQVLALAVIVRVWLGGGRDDHWAVMLSVIALCLTVSWAWLKVAPIGPLEWVLRLPGRMLARVPVRA